MRNLNKYQGYTWHAQRAWARLRLPCVACHSAPHCGSLWSWSPLWGCTRRTCRWRWARGCWRASRSWRSSPGSCCGSWWQGCRNAGSPLPADLRKPKHGRQNRTLNSLKKWSDLIDWGSPGSTDRSTNKGETKAPKSLGPFQPFLKQERLKPAILLNDVRL